MIPFAVHAQGPSAASNLMLDSVGGVLGQVPQPESQVVRQVIEVEGGAGELEQAVELLGVGKLMEVAHGPECQAAFSCRSILALPAAT